MGNPICVSSIIFHVKSPGISGKLGGNSRAGVDVIAGMGEGVMDGDEIEVGVCDGFGIGVGGYPASELQDISKATKKRNKNCFFKTNSLVSNFGFRRPK